ncbi:DUF2306 domain-containing protein [Brevibacillus laterosporus]|uniref:DUF2306 domain-containing protein n=1 Tax=Brevibacillus laterosporus TaxID=1465 RepID=UPI002E1ECA57|nr:DUF2306 domain-containing protein [Brevibacillus laterosporus]
MSIFQILIALHILAGTVCLLTGLLAIIMRKKRGFHTIYGEIYHGSYVVIFLTSIITAIWHWEESAYLFFIALFSYGLALYGYLARKRRWTEWVGKHIYGMLGSYIGVITAVLVVNQAKIPVLNQWPSLLLWLLPTIIGSPLIAMVQRQSGKRKMATKRV